jgi:hypothetical protein
MKLRFTEKAGRASRAHPSLGAKEYFEARYVWQGRMTRDWRLYFPIDGDQ